MLVFKRLGGGGSQSKLFSLTIIIIIFFILCFIIGLFFLWFSSGYFNIIFIFGFCFISLSFFWQFRAPGPCANDPLNPSLAVAWLHPPQLLITPPKAISCDLFRASAKKPATYLRFTRKSSHLTVGA